MRFRLSIFACLTFIFFFTTSGAVTQSRPDQDRAFSSWLREGTGKTLSGDRAEYLSVTEEAYLAGVPDDYFITRTGEALAKSVPSSRILSSMREEMPILLELASLISKHDWPDTAKRARFFADSMAAMRNGVRLRSVSILVSDQRTAELDPLRAGAALGAQAASFRSFSPPSDPDMSGLASDIAYSKIGTDKFGSLVSLAVRARIERVPNTDFYGTLSKNLKEGVSFAEIERAVRGGQRP